MIQERSGFPILSSCLDFAFRALHAGAEFIFMWVDGMERNCGLALASNLFRSMSTHFITFLLQGVC